MPTVTRRCLLASAAVATPALIARPALAREAFHSPCARVAAPGVMHLSYWGGWTGPDGAVMQRLVRRFNAQSRDIQVTLTLYNWDLIFDRWRTEFDGGAPPDIVGIHATEVAQYAANGMLRNIAREARRYGLDASSFYPPPWRLCAVEGGLYGIPLDIHPLALYINRRGALRAGLDPARPPRNGAELLAWAARLSDPRHGVWGYAAPAQDVESFRQWYTLLYQFGGRFMNDAQTRCLANSAPGIAAYAFLRDLITPRRVAMPQEGPVDDDFITERVMMYLQGPWYIQGIQQAGLDVITAPAPRIGARPAVWSNSHVLGVVNTLDDRRADAAMRFIAWLDAHALAWAEAGQVPARNDARSRLRTTSIWPRLRPFAAELPYIVYQPNVLVHSELFAENAATPVIGATQAVLLGSESPAEAVRAMAGAVDQLVSAP